ncbi:MAG: Flp family type IVb pilin [Thermoleophilia bacterium]|nr:Flp family type IVb pilin [Thermoleophilia bacterium]
MLFHVPMVYFRGILAKMRSEEGATAVEYGLMVALIAVVIIGAVAALGLALSGKFQTVADKVGGAGATTPAS